LPSNQDVLKNVPKISERLILFYSVTTENIEATEMLFMKLNRNLNYPVFSKYWHVFFFNFNIFKAFSTVSAFSG